MTKPGPRCMIVDCANQWIVGPVHHQRDDCAARPARSGPTVVVGMGPEAPVIENTNGARQSEIPAVFTTMPLRALWALAKLQKYGDDKYGPHNWRGITEQDHVDHAFAHLLADRLGDATDDHLLHATWRLMAALEDRLTRRNGNEHGAF